MRRRTVVVVLLASATARTLTDLPQLRVSVNQRHRISQTRCCDAAVLDPPEPDLQAAQPKAAVPLPPIWPCGDELDKRITKLAVPALINFLILPITAAVDLLFIGKIGSALATAGQAAANQVYSTAALLTNVIPVVTVPLVAKAHAAGNTDDVQRQVGGAIFLSVLFGMLVTLIVGIGQQHLLLAVGSAAALPFSMPYLLWRLPGVIPDALATVGFSSLRGVMDTVTPLKVSIAAFVTNAVLNYLLIFPAKMGIGGAALATAIAQLVSGATFMAILLRRKLVRWSTALRPPSKEMLAKLAASGGAVQVRSVALNVAFVAITRRTQTLDTTGVAAAAHAVTIALWQLGGVVLFAMGSSATILTSAELGKKDSTAESSRSVARRMIAWGALMGAVLGGLQVLGLPLLGLFTPLPDVQRAARVPSLIGAALQLINGVVFVGEGVMVAAGAFGRLASGQVLATALFLLSLRFAPTSLVGVWMSFWVFNSVRLANFCHYFWASDSPLMPAKQRLP